MGSRIDNSRCVLRALLAEREEYAGWRIPDTLEEQQSMTRALPDVRFPRPVSPEFLPAQDAELRQQLADKVIITLSDIPLCQSDSRLRKWRIRMDWQASLFAAYQRESSVFRKSEPRK